MQVMRQYVHVNVINIEWIGKLSFKLKVKKIQSVCKKKTINFNLLLVGPTENYTLKLIHYIY